MLSSKTPDHIQGTLPLVLGSENGPSHGAAHCVSSLEPTSRDDCLRLAALTELVSHVSCEVTPEAACQTLANELQLFLNVEQVAVGVCSRRHSHCDLLAVSGQRQLDPKAESTGLLTATMHECLARGEQGECPTNVDDKRHALCAHRQLVRSKDNAAVLSIPLCDARNVVRGVCLVVGPRKSVQSAELRAYLDAASAPLGSALSLIQRARGNRFDRLERSSREFAKSNAAKIVISVFAAILGVLAIPVRYYVACDGELQPQLRRFIAAPFDARLDHNHVQPGDFVTRGQLLAELDASEVQWELSSKRAEAHRVAKEMAGYVAAHDSANAEISRLELTRLELLIEQVEDRAAKLEIRSPLDGMLLAGDHSKSQGVPLEKGSTLFEIAPLDRMVVELRIPEDDVRFVHAGLPVRVRLDAFPRAPFEGALTRVHPRAELHEHANVFVAEVEVENAGGMLRPGMRGSASIATVRRPLAWNLFHKAYAATLAWLGW